MIIRPKLLVLFVALLALAAGCTETNKPTDPVKRQRVEPQFRHDGYLWVMDGIKGDTLSSLRIEIVEKQKDIQYGMMFRSSMEQHTGMLFLMKQERPQSFYMKNTLISLDIIYINSNRNIVSIVENAEPLSEKSLPSGKPAIYILEVPGGYAKQQGIKVGDKIAFERK